MKAKAKVDPKSKRGLSTKILEALARVESKQDALAQLCVAQGQALLALNAQLSKLLNAGAEPANQPEPAECELKGHRFQVVSGQPGAFHSKCSRCGEWSTEC